ncbi:MAG: DNA repair protein RadC [Proteobacteria bacterium]|nr:DNA repair protein RadC [Pseudomonadota bacterium]
MAWLSWRRAKSSPARARLPAHCHQRPAGRRGRHSGPSEAWRGAAPALEQITNTQRRSRVYDAEFQLTPGEPSAPAFKPSHAGHRDRLRERAAAGDLDALPDYEMLELMLFRAIPQRDVKPLARALIARFKSLAGVLGAYPADLKTVTARDNSGKLLRVTDAVALDLKLVHQAACRMGRVRAATALQEDAARERLSISSWSALNDYVRTRLAHEAREQVRVLFLDRKNQLIADELMNRGTVDHAAVYPREVVRRALELSASALILVHNHPSGDPTPSRADVDITRQIVEAAKAMGIAVHDHLVVGRDGVASLKALGLM